MRSRNGEYLAVVGTNSGDVHADDDEDDDLDESNADGDGFDDDFDGEDKDDDREILLLENAKDSSTKNDVDNRSSTAAVTAKSVSTAEGDDKVFVLRLLLLRRGVSALRSRRRCPMPLLGQTEIFNGLFAPSSPVDATATAVAIVTMIQSAGH